MELSGVERKKDFNMEIAESAEGSPVAFANTAFSRVQLFSVVDGDQVLWSGD